MRLVIDNNIRDSLTKYLTDSGHEVHHVRTALSKDAPDPAIVDLARTLQAVVITHNYKHFLGLAERSVISGLLENCTWGLICVRCGGPLADSRVQHLWAVIEEEHAKARQRAAGGLLLHLDINVRTYCVQLMAVDGGD